MQKTRLPACTIDQHCYFGFFDGVTRNADVFLIINDNVFAVC